MGAVDLVIQIEAPTSVASGLQRIGRASHGVGGVPRGVLLPKHRQDLVSCAAATASMRRGEVEETFYPRNPLDVLAQQIVATVAMGETTERDALRSRARRGAVRGSAPRARCDGVLDMLSGRYPSDDFADLRPRITWDRARGRITARAGASASPSPAAGPSRTGGSTASSRRREMRGPRTLRRPAGDGWASSTRRWSSSCGRARCSSSGASSWRAEKITHDRVLVTPAAGQPGKMPFWHGDRPGRARPFGMRIGELVRDIASGRAGRRRSSETTMRWSPLRRLAITAYVRDQVAATGEVPSDRAIVIERFVDEIGDWRVVVLCPLGARVIAPWAIAVAARLREKYVDAEVHYTDDGMAFRVPACEEAPPAELLLPSADAIETLVTRALEGSALFAARFRECAGRALLLPRRDPGRRTPLWAQRKRAGDPARGRVASPGLSDRARDLPRVPARRLRSAGPRGAPARRRGSTGARDDRGHARSLAIRRERPLRVRRELHLRGRRAARRATRAGDGDRLRPAARAARRGRDPAAPRRRGASRSTSAGSSGSRAPRRTPTPCTTCSWRLATCRSTSSARAASPPERAEPWARELAAARRIVALRVGGQSRFVAAEDAAKLSDALGLTLPRRPARGAARAADDTGCAISWRATRGPTAPSSPATSPLASGSSRASVAGAIAELVGRGAPRRGRVPARAERRRELCDREVLEALRRKSLAKLRRAVEPVEPRALARLAARVAGRPQRHGAGATRCSRSSASSRAARSSRRRWRPPSCPRASTAYRPWDLDALCASGEVRWAGLEPIGRERRANRALPRRPRGPPRSARARRSRGPQRHRCAPCSGGAGPSSSPRSRAKRAASPARSSTFCGRWSGPARSPTTRSSLCAAARGPRRPSRRGGRARHPRAPRTGPPGSEGRWSLRPWRRRRASERHRPAQPRSPARCSIATAS